MGRQIYFFSENEPIGSTTHIANEQAKANGGINALHRNEHTKNNLLIKFMLISYLGWILIGRKRQRRQRPASFHLRSASIVFSNRKIVWNNWSCFYVNGNARSGGSDYEWNYDLVVHNALSISTLFASSMQLNGNNGNDFNVLSDRLGSFCILCRLIFVFDTATQQPGVACNTFSYSSFPPFRTMFWNFIENHNFNEMNIPGKTWHFSSFSLSLSCRSIRTLAFHVVGFDFVFFFSNESSRIGWLDTAINAIGMRQWNNNCIYSRCASNGQSSSSSSQSPAAECATISGWQRTIQTQSDERESAYSAYANCKLWHERRRLWKCVKTRDEKKKRFCVYI